MKEGGYPSRIQGRSNNSPIHTKGKDSHRGISLLYCLLPGRYWPNPTFSIAWTSWSGWNSTRKSVWIQERQKINRYDSFRQAFRTKTSKTKYGPQHGLCPQFQRFWHSQPWCHQGSPGVGRNTFLSSPHLCFIIVLICYLFVSRDDPLMS